MTELDYLLGAGFFLIAILYSSVGHAGASGYLALMALVGLSGATLRPAALALNVLVGSIGTFRFARAGLVEWQRVLPFLIGSIPAAFIGGSLQLDATLYRKMLGVILIFGAIQIVRSAIQVSKAHQEKPVKAIPWPLALIAGAAIGLLSGLTGTGGGIFLTPLVLIAGWALMRQAAGMTAPFVLFNSMAGLAGLQWANIAWPAALPLWLGCVGVGALIGTQLGTRWLPVAPLRYALALVLLIASWKLLVA